MARENLILLTVGILLVLAPKTWTADPDGEQARAIAALQKLGLVGIPGHGWFT